jgi:hypothetical protein
MLIVPLVASTGWASWALAVTVTRCPGEAD